MKRILVILFLSAAFQSLACDICSVYSAIEPNSFKSRIGFNYRSSFYKGKPLIGLKHGGFNDYYVKELYDYYELSGRYFNQKTQLAIQGSIPIVNRYRSLNEGIQIDNWGFGDPQLQLVYRALNTKKCIGGEDENLVNRLEVGLGVKMPLGKTNVAYNGVLSDMDMQLGSGSWDLLATLQYVLKVKSWGFGLDVAYQFNNNGRTGYHYGDAFTMKLKGFYFWKKGDWGLIPTLGVSANMGFEDRYQGTLYYDSGEFALLDDLGFNVYWKRFQINTSFSLPMMQYFKGYETPLKYNFSVGFFVNI